MSQRMVISRGNPKNSDENFLQCQFVHSSHLKSRGTETGSLLSEASGYLSELCRV